jgi:PLP dependent protein
MIETVASSAGAQRLNRIAGEMSRPDAYPVLLEVNVDRDPAKAGFSPDELERSIEAVLACGHLEVRGLMTVGRLVRDPTEARPTFVALRALSERLRSTAPALGAELSMGMTDDFEVAVEEGATIVRVGRALFGERDHDHPDGQALDQADGHRH